MAGATGELIGLPAAAPAATPTSTAPETVISLLKALTNSASGGATSGAQANAWSAAAVLAGATSASLDTGNDTVCAYFGTANAATTIVPQFSQDNTNFYDVNQYQVAVGAGSSFGMTFPLGARYVRLKSTAAATITATIASKGT